MACGSCGGGAVRMPVHTADGAVEYRSVPQHRWEVVLPNGSAIAARDNWDAVQKQAMYGGAIREIRPDEGTAEQTA